MPILSSQDQVIATVCLDECNNVAKVLPGNATRDTPKETFDYVSVLITERMLMEMNSFARAKWQNAFKDVARGRDPQQSQK